MSETNWLDGQTVTIPIEEFIKMKIEKTQLDQYSTEIHIEKMRLTHELDDTKTALAEAKKQLRELLGIERSDVDVKYD